VDVAVEAPAVLETAGGDLDISVVIPCLNEARTVSGCVAAALEGIEAAGLGGEVIVADNGSTDGSVAAAEAAGARVVHVTRRGYGAALQAGFLAARGRLLVMGDADQSYNFRELPKLVDEQRRTEADVVLGDRLGGRIEQGAMPWTHRWIGNPLISLTIRRLFRVPLNDCYCGLRLLTRESHRRLRLRSSSMEYALEMIVQGALVGLRFSQVPITLHVDGRDRAPHLRTMRDGYRSFRFLFQHAPITLYGIVGGPAVLLGLALLARAAWQEIGGGPPASFAATLGGAFVVSGWLLVVLGVIARVFVTGFLGGQTDHPLQGLFRVARLETAVVAAALTLALGLTLAFGVGRWEALVQLGLTLSVVAMGTFVGAFVVSLVGRAIPVVEPERLPVSGGARPQVLALLPRDEVERPAPNHDRWLAEVLGAAWAGAGRVLDFGTSVGGVTRAIAGASQAEQFAVLRVDPEAAQRLIEPLADTPPAPPETSERFDVVVSAGLLERVEDDVAALRCMAAPLAPGGRLVLLAAGGGDRLYGRLDVEAGRLRRYTVPRLRSRLRAAGLETVHVRHMDAAGALRWFVAGRWRPAGAVGHWPLDGVVPVVRRVEAVVGPPFGRWLVVVARTRKPID
jgi:SAM-dependent methyltransferase